MVKLPNREYLKRFKQSILPVFFLLFSILGYGPLELWLSNRSSEEMWFTFGDVLSPLLVIGIISLVALMVILTVLPTRLYRISLAIITALGILFFLQGFFLPNGYGELNGAQIDWSQYTSRFVYNTAIWVAVIAAAIVLAIKKWKEFHTAAVFVSILLIVVQVVSLTAVGIIGNKDSKDKNLADVFLTTDKLYTVSGGGNTIVFILDAFDSQLMCDLLDRFPEELSESFADFTFYHNTSGGATRTKYGIPYILTSKTNDTGDAYSVYLKESFETSPLFRELRTGKYDSCFYTNDGYIDRSQNVAIDNLSSGVKLKPSSPWGLASSMLKMTAFKYMPHALKRFFWMYSGELSQWKGGSVESTAYTSGNITFHDGLMADGLSVEGSETAFRFIHLDGVHGPFTMDENMQRISEGYGTEDMQGLGALRIVSDYIQQMKSNGVYDDANIFIMADHGDADYSNSHIEQNPLLMVKEADSHKNLSSSDIRLSYKNVSSMFVDALHGDLNIEKNYRVNGIRYSYVGLERNNSYKVVEFASDGDSYDAKSWHETGVYYTYEKPIDYEYKLGTMLYFGVDGIEGSTARKYMENGFAHFESDFAWTDGTDVEMRFDVGPVDSNILLEFDYLRAMNKYQRCYVYAADTLVGSFIATHEASQSMVIPKEAVIDGVLRIRMLLPDAYIQYVHKTGLDKRKLGLMFSTIRLDLTDTQFDSEAQSQIIGRPGGVILFDRDGQYDLGTALSFTIDDNNGAQYVRKGMAESEKTETWTVGNEMEMGFIVGDILGDMICTMAYRSFEDQHVIIEAGGAVVEEFDASGAEERTFNIPASAVQDGELTLVFHLPNAHSPQSEGLNEDVRELGLAFKTMVIDTMPQPQQHPEDTETN